MNQSSQQHMKFFSLMSDVAYVLNKTNYYYLCTHIIEELLSKLIKCSKINQSNPQNNQQSNNPISIPSSSSNHCIFESSDAKILSERNALRSLSDCVVSFFRVCL